MDILTSITILVLAAFVGFEVISKVPNTLHTPLMSATNAVHGIVVIGALYLIGRTTGFLNDLLLVIAIAFGTINVVGGFLVTDRMLGMFKGRKREVEGAGAKEVEAGSAPTPATVPVAEKEHAA
jgi:NAD(P) transhydrogenase subunit alpha